MIHVLTRNARLRGRLALLLRELGHNAQFFEGIQDSVDATDGGARFLLLVDIDCRGDWYAVEPPDGVPRVIVESPERISPESVKGRPSNTEFYVLLPHHTHRAKERLRSVINKALMRLPPAKHLIRERVPRAPSSGAPLIRPAPEIKQSRLSPAMNQTIADIGAARARQAPSEPPPEDAHREIAEADTGASGSPRYLVAESPAAQRFLAQLRASKDFPGTLVFQGPDGAEFETAAREVNFLVNGDRQTLSFISPDDFSIERLQQMEKAERPADGPRICFLQRLEEIQAEPARQLAEIIGRLCETPSPSLRLITAVREKQRYVDPDAGPLVEEFLKDLPHIEIPPLSERRADVRPLALRLLSMMLEAHPFLVVREISPEALSLLEEKSETLQFGDIVSLLRNAFALASRPVVGVADLNGLLESDHTGRHLLESAADEQCFPSAEEMW